MYINMCVYICLYFQMVWQFNAQVCCCCFFLAHPRNSWLVERCGMSLAELQGKPIATVLHHPSKKVIKVWNVGDARG